MTVTTNIERLKELENTYSRRGQYSLLLLFFISLPLITFIDDDGGGLHIRSAKQLIRDFGEVGTPLLLSFTLITFVVGVYSWLQLRKLSKLRWSREREEYDAKKLSERQLRAESAPIPTNLSSDLVNPETSNIKLNIPDDYMDGFLHASDALGITISKEDVLARPTFATRMFDSMSEINAYECALYNALGIIMNDQIANPKPYPNKLHLTLATAMQWVESEKITKNFYAFTVDALKAKLQEHNLTL